MKITFLSPPPNLSGGERVVAIYTKKLAERGHEVEVVCVDHARIPLTRRVKSFARGRGWPGQRKIGASHFEQYGIRYRVLGHSGPITDRDVNDADAVIATFWTTAAWAKHLGSNKGRKYYLVQGDEGGLRRDLPEVEATYDYNLQNVYVSNWIAERICARHPDASGCVVNNAVEMERFDRGPRHKDPDAVVGVMCSATRFKGVEIAMEALRRAKERLPDVRLIGFGAKQPPEEWAVHFERFEVQPNADRLAEVYASCRAWLFPSRFEGFGLPILEAMAARTPVIGTRTGAGADLITPENGRLIDVDDVYAMADAIVEVTTLDFTSWQAMSEAAYCTAGSHTWDDATDRLEAVLSG